MIKRKRPDIQKDMYKWAEDHLYLRTSEEWSSDSQEADPLVHLLIGACAAQAEEVYHYIHNSDDRLMKRMLRYLLPESFHLPVPAVAVAKATARVKDAVLESTQALTFENSEQRLNFSPLFETRIINGQIKIIGTDQHLYDYQKKSASKRLAKTHNINRLLIGIELGKTVRSLEKVNFYINWKGEASEKRQLIQAFAKSQWKVNGRVVERQNGFLKANQLRWENQLDTEKNWLQKINNQYKKQFHHLVDSSPIKASKQSASEVLETWLSHTPEQENNLTKTLINWNEETQESQLVWLEIQLPYSIELTNLEQNLIFDLNHFLVANRSYQYKDDNETYFSRSLGLEIIRLQPEKGLFQSIKAVQNQIKQVEIPSKSLAHLIEEKGETAYHFRMGGVGRKDEYNTWERLSYMLSMFRKEHKYQEIFERLGHHFSLEEFQEMIAHIVGKSNQTPLRKEGEQVPVYVLVQTGKSRSQLRIKVEYWLTDGKNANGIAPESELHCNPPVAGLDKSSVKLVTSPAGGKSENSPSEQLQAVQDALFRRGRIVTAHDVKSLCFNKFGQALQGVDLRPYFEVDKNSKGGGLRRGIEVLLTLEEGITQIPVEQIAQEIELTLQENSIGMAPYRVVLQ